jgi:hypothetical protein
MIIENDYRSIESEFNGKGYYQKRPPVKIITQQAPNAKDSQSGYNA